MPEEPSDKLDRSAPRREDTKGADTLERGSWRRAAGMPRPSSGLPQGAEPASPSLSQQRQELAVELDELRGALMYMGDSHPKRRVMEQRLKQLTTIVEQMDQLLGL